MKKVIITLCLSMLLTACSNVIAKRQAIKNYDFNIRSSHIENLGLTSLTLRIKVDIYNPNKTDVILNRLDADIWINGKYVGKSVSRAQRNITPGQPQNVTLDMNIKYAGVYKTYQNIQKGEKLEYKIKGNIYCSAIFGDIVFPFEK